MKDVKIVIGASFGDEGKGLMTDYFAGDAATRGETTLVVCSNGGAQRGHTVKAKCNATGQDTEVRHVFHHFGSGTYAGADTYLPYFFILNPMLFVKEYFEIEEEYGGLPQVFVHSECFVSTPFDMILNQMLEEHRGNGRHGSCGMGIWETLVRRGINYGNLMGMTDGEIRKYLGTDCRQYLWKRLKEKGVKDYRPEWREIIEDDGLIEHYIEDLRFMQNYCEVADVNIFDRYDRVIFEGGQGLLLDRCRKEYGNNTTPSNTGIRNPYQLLKEYNLLKNNQLQKVYGTDNDSLEKISVEVCYVSRTYLTRHGAGRFDEECDKADINPNMVDLTNVPNPHQGTIRYGKLSSKSLLRRIKEDFDSSSLPMAFEPRKTLAVTHINEYISDIVKEADYISGGETRDSVEKREKHIATKVDATYYLNYNMS